MRDLRDGFRGAVDAAGLIVDASLIGVAQARRRVLAAWSPGSVLHELPDGRWLLVAGHPMHLRAERAPGAAVVERGGGLVAGGAAAGRPGALTECRDGREIVHPLAAMRRLDPSAWLDLGGVQAVALEPLDAEPAPTPVAPAERRETPDLRAQAAVGDTSARARRLLEQLRRRESRTGRGGTAGRGQGSSGGGRGLWARAVLRSPARGVVGRRHLRYLEGLERAFREGNYDSALRDAIRIGGAGTGALSLRLPRPRKGPLGPSPQGATGGGTVPWGPTMGEHLSELYRQAAERLEREGRIDEAAFVHADLLDAPRDAVALLERHRRYDIAARLAEGRGLEPGLAVRLYWLARDRRRAVAVARSRGGWAEAVERMQAVDAEATRALRAEWVADARGAGDHLTAVDAAWPDDELRAQATADLDVLRARGGTMAARALALGLVLRETERDVAEAVALLDAVTPEAAPERAAFAAALAGERAAAPSLDRRLSSGAVRALLRDASTPGTLTDREHRRTLNELRERADPLLRADLPAVDVRPPAPQQLQATATAPAEAGSLDVLDAVWLDGGLLVAAGPAGLVRIGAGGRALQRWDVHAHGLVVADAGGVVLVTTHGEATVDVHRFTVRDRRLRRWATLGRCALLPSFDGRVLTIVDRDGLAGIDTLEPRPVELWREFNSDCRIVSIARSPSSMAAVVDAPLQGIRDRRSLELWRWDLPESVLRTRAVHDQPALGEDSRVTASGRLLRIVESEAGPRLVAGGEGRAARLVVAGDAVLRASGDVYATEAAEDGAVRVDVRPPDADDPAATVHWPGPLAGLREHDGVVTLWDAGGRIVAVRLSPPRLLASLRASR
jgi:hypothetical protein